MSSGRIINPTQPEFGCANTRNGMADTVALPPMQTANGAAILTFGGLTMLEYMAAHVAASGNDRSASEIVDKAQAILAECAKRQAPKQVTE